MYCSGCSLALSQGANNLHGVRPANRGSSRFPVRSAVSKYDGSVRDGVKLAEWV